MNKPDSLMYDMFNKQRTSHNMTIINGESWFATLLTVLNKLELEHMLHDFNNNFNYLPCISQRLRDQYVQVWNDTLSTQPKLYYYRMFKNVFSYKSYLDCIKNISVVKLSLGLDEVHTLCLLKLVDIME